MSESRRQLLAILAVAAPTCAVLPVAADLEGGWVALHLAGGALSLAILLWAAWRLGGTARWAAYAAIGVSLLVIGVVTGGGTVGTAIEVALLVGLGSIYVYCVGQAIRAGE